jgi:hypothetical protein
MKIEDILAPVNVRMESMVVVCAPPETNKGAER